MKLARHLFAWLAVLASLLGSGAALAWNQGRGYVGVYVGVPAYYGPRPYYYYPRVFPYYLPYYPYYPPVVAAPSAPAVYIERSNPPSAQSQWWYFCPDSNGYYPYVRECPGDWQRVAPLPPPG